MLLNTEELLALINGDVEPDRLADLLDRLEHCPDSAAALQVLVTLRANREEALEALRTAAETELASATAFPHPAPHPAARQMALSGWALQGLRMAASFALIAMIGIWALSSPVSSFLAEQTVSSAGLAATDLAGQIVTHRFEAEEGLELTSEASASLIEAASDLHDAYEFTEAIELLQGSEDTDPEVRLLLAFSHYRLGDFDNTWDVLRRVSAESIEDYNVRFRYLWLEANTLLSLDRPFQALLSLEQLRARRANAFLQPEAAEKYAEVAALLGLTLESAAGR